jgi:hypothetical protein
MTPHHFGIYSNIPEVDGRFFAEPCASSVSENEFVISLVQEKSISRFGDDVEYPCDLIMSDESLINDLINLDCYVLLLASKNTVVDENTKYWDAALDLDGYSFLGWTIADYLGGNYAFCDGVFPIQGVEIDCSDKYSLTVVDEKSVNEWGLIEDERALDYYMKINKELTVRYINQQHVSRQVQIDWQSYGVFCDKFTFSKLSKLKAT